MADDKEILARIISADSVPQVAISKDQHLDIMNMLSKIEQVVSPLVIAIRDKYPSILVEIHTQCRRKRTKYDTVKGGAVQATYLNVGGNVLKGNDRPICFDTWD